LSWNSFEKVRQRTCDERELPMLGLVHLLVPGERVADRDLHSQLGGEILQFGLSGPKLGPLLSQASAVMSIFLRTRQRRAPSWPSILRP
jgi:hypothetical protein